MSVRRPITSYFPEQEKAGWRKIDQNTEKLVKLAQAPEAQAPKFHQTEKNVIAYLKKSEEASRALFEIPMAEDVLKRAQEVEYETDRLRMKLQTFIINQHPELTELERH